MSVFWLYNLSLEMSKISCRRLPTLPDGFRGSCRESYTPPARDQLPRFHHYTFCSFRRELTLYQRGEVPPTLSPSDVHVFVRRMRLIPFRWRRSHQPTHDLAVEQCAAGGHRRRVQRPGHRVDVRRSSALFFLRGKMVPAIVAPLCCGRLSHQVRHKRSYTNYEPLA